MHREHIQTAILAAAEGSAVAIFAENIQRAQQLAREVEAALQGENVARLSRENGRQFIELNGGGIIRFISTRQSARGLSLDRVFVPVGIDRKFLEDIVPCLVTSPEGVLTGY
ncbi:hypothetical protein ACVWY0_003204 [Arthrobacter sp. UYNi723]